MSKGILARSGNSYVIRVPKSYVTEHGLCLGDKIDLPDPNAGQRRALDRLVELSDSRKGLNITDPVAWQREQRDADDRWDAQHI